MIKPSKAGFTVVVSDRLKLRMKEHKDFVTSVACQRFDFSGGLSFILVFAYLKTLWLL